MSDKNINKLLTAKFGKINDCTSENDNNERPENQPAINRYDETKCNIGTNFKSGVSIRKDNHAFIIILPSRSTRSKFKNNYGIFSSGITSIIQALARQRTKGEIHIILPKPDEFDFSSLKKNFTKNQCEAFKEAYNKISQYNPGDDSKPVEYIPLNYQKSLVKDFYEDDLKANVQKGIDYLQKYNRDNLARLEYPHFKNFLLEESEEFLASYHKFFGGDLSAYVTYCAFTNQFVNCYLEGVSYKKPMEFTEGKIQETLMGYFEFYFGENFYYGVIRNSNFHLAYQEFRKYLFKNFIIKYSNKETADGKKEYTKVTEYSNSNFEQQLLRFMAFLYYGKSYSSENFSNRKKDLPYTKSNYLLDSIASANLVSENSTDYVTIKSKIKAFKGLNHFREKLIRNIATHNRRNINYKYLTREPFEGFIDNDDQKLYDFVVNYLKKEDPYTSNSVYPLSKTFIGNSTKVKTSFYNLLIDNLFKYEEMPTIPRLTIGGKKKSVFPEIRAIELPTGKFINLVEQPDYDFEMPMETFIEQDEKNPKINKALLEKISESVTED